MTLFVLSYASGTYVSLHETRVGAEAQAEKNKNEFGGLTVHYPIIREVEVQS